MKLQEMIYSIIQATRDFSDNSFVQEEYIKFMINTFRAKYLHQAYSNKPVLEPINRQTIILPMELVNSSYDASVIKTKNRILRTVDTIPKILQLGRKPAIHSISSLDRIELGEFELVDKKRAQYNVYSPFCGVTGYLDTDYHIYFVTSVDEQKFLKNIVLDAVFERPEDVLYLKYPDQTDSVSALDLEEYPVDMGMWTSIKAEITAEMLRAKGVPLDMQSATPNPDARAAGAPVNPRIN
ncbi:MAG: hypothetical protein KAH32_04480 [Chlamydiia bacterium]|nr:hypothetical protein [Chlamydiia bacterium]